MEPVGWTIRHNQSRVGRREMKLGQRTKKIGSHKRKKRGQKTAQGHRFKKNTKKKKVEK